MSTIEQVGKSRLLRISADDKLLDSQKTENFSVNVNGGSVLSSVRRIVLKSCIFPNVFYNVKTDFNDTLRFTESGQPDVEITIPQGFYTESDLKTAIETAANALFVSTVLVINIDSIDKRWFWDFTTNDAAVHPEDGSGLSTLASNVGVYDDPGAPAGSQISDVVPSLAGLTEVFIVSTQLAKANMIDGDQTKSIISNIPITAPFGGINTYESKDDELDSINYDDTLGRTINNIIDIQVQDRQGNLVDLQRHNIKLVFKVYF